MGCLLIPSIRILVWLYQTPNKHTWRAEILKLGAESWQLERRHASCLSTTTKQPQPELYMFVGTNAQLYTLAYSPRLAQIGMQCAKPVLSLSANLKATMFMNVTSVA